MEKALLCSSGERLFPAFTEQNVPIFLSTDGKYFPHCMTAIASVLANGAKDNRYDIIVIVNEVDVADMVMALDWAAQFDNCRLRFLDARECLDLDGMGKYYVTDIFPITVYFRLWAPSIFQNYDKILYLDSDLVALADVADLYGEELDDALVAAAHDFKFENELRDSDSSVGNRFLENAKRCRISFGTTEPYFNSGVMVMNLHAMRAEETQRDFIVTSRLVVQPLLPDQDVLNLVCRKRVKFIEPVWNFVEWMDEAKRPDAKVLHFAAKKPWHFRYAGGNGGSYWLYSRMTPATLHNRVVDCLRSQSTLSANACSFIRLVFHLARSFGLSPFAFGAIQKERYARRRQDYRREMRLLLRHWFNLASSWFPGVYAALEGDTLTPKSESVSSG